MVTIQTPVTPLHRYTVDVEFDQGGRTDGEIGLGEEGLGRIFKLFKRRGIIGLFFVSTEVVDRWGRVVRAILENGHQVGSHGHRHLQWPKNRAGQLAAQDDMERSFKVLQQWTKRALPYRAPKFSHITECIYSDPKNHVSLLKHLWLKEKITRNTIIYMHPFDFVKSKKHPNLFCQFWYSKPEKVYDTLNRITLTLPDSYIS